MSEPAFRSLALDAIPRPDFADVHVVPLPPGASTDPRLWVAQIFDIASTPAWVIALMGVRQAVVGLIGVRSGTQHAFDIQGRQPRLGISAPRRPDTPLPRDSLEERARNPGFGGACLGTRSPPSSPRR